MEYNKFECPACNSEDLEGSEDDSGGWERSCNNCKAFFGVSSCEKRFPWDTGFYNFFHSGKEFKALQKALDGFVESEAVKELWEALDD